MPIQKIKSGRVSTVASNSYVGSKGVIFYDEQYGDLRLSDGTTPGGIPLLTGNGSSSTNLQIGSNPPSVALDGTLFWSPTDQTMLVKFNDTWNPATKLIPATESVLGGLKIGKGLVSDESGLTNVKVEDLIRIVATPKMPIIGNRCELPSIPIGDFVYNVAVVYRPDGLVEEHDNLGFIIDNEIPYLEFKDTEFEPGYHAVVSYAEAI